MKVVHPSRTVHHCTPSLTQHPHTHQVKREVRLQAHTHHSLITHHTVISHHSSLTRSNVRSVCRHSLITHHSSLITHQVKREVRLQGDCCQLA